MKARASGEEETDRQTEKEMTSNNFAQGVNDVLDILSDFFFF